MALVMTTVVVTVGFMTQRNQNRTTTSGYLLADQYTGLFESPKASWSLYYPPCSWEQPSSNTDVTNVERTRDVERPSAGTSGSDGTLCSDVVESELWEELSAGDTVTFEDGSTGIVVREPYRKRFVEYVSTGKRSLRPRAVDGPMGIAVDVLYTGSGVRRALRVIAPSAASRDP